MNQKALQRAVCFSDIPAMAMSFLLPLYCIELGFTPIETTGLFAIVSLALLLSKLIIGNACDKIGRKKVLFCGMVLQAISYGVLAFSQSAVALYAGQTLKGVAISFSSVAMYAMMSDDMESNFASRQAKLASSRGKGQLVGVAVCWGLLSVATFTDAWKFLLLISAASALYAALFSRKALIETNDKAFRIKIDVPKKLQKLFCVNIPFTIAISIVNAILMLYLFNRFSARTEFMAVILLVPAALTTYTSPIIGKVIARYGEMRCFAWGCLGSAVTLCAIPLLGSIIGFAVLWTIYNIVVSFSGFAFDSIIAVNSDIQIKGKVSGTYMASSNLGTFIGSISSGLAFQLFSVTMPFYMAAMFFAATWLAILFVVSNSKDIEISGFVK